MSDNSETVHHELKDHKNISEGLSQISKRLDSVDGQLASIAAASARNEKDVWDKMSSLGAFVSLVGVPIVLAILGNQLNQSLKKSDGQIKTLELAITVLNEDPKVNPDSKSLREWAVRVIDTFSGVSLSEQAIAELQSRPIVRTQSQDYSCLGGTARLLTEGSTTATISESAESGCIFLVNGAVATGQPSARCQSIKASVFVPVGMRVGIMEGRNSCVFGVSWFQHR